MTMISVKWLPILSCFSILFLAGLACTLSSSGSGLPTNLSRTPDALYTIRQLPAQGDWIIGERTGDKHFFAIHVETGERLALNLKQGGLAFGGEEPDALPPFSTGYLSYSITWDGRYTFNPPKTSETNYSIETADGTLQVVYQSQSQFELVTTGSNGQQRSLAQGERPSGKTVEDIRASDDSRFIYIYWHTGYPNPGYPEFMVVDTASGSSRTLIQINEAERLFKQGYALSPDGQTLYIGLPDRLEAISAVNGASRTVFRIRNSKQALADFSLSPDGQRLVYLQRMEECRGRRDIEGNPIPDACRFELFLINVDGKEQKQFTDGLADTPAVRWIAWWQGPEPGQPTLPTVEQAHQLHTLPVISEGLAGGQLILLETTNGLLALSPRQTKPVLWQPGTEAPLAEVLTSGQYAQFGDTFYLRDGRWADLSQLSRPVSGRVLISPNGRYIAYETFDGVVSDQPAPYIYLEDLLDGDGRPILDGGTRILSWFDDDKALLAKRGDEIIRFYLGKIPLTEGHLGRFTTSNEARPQVTYYETAANNNNKGILWRAGTQLLHSTGANQPLTETLHPTTPFVLAPDNNSVAWIDQTYPQLRVYSMFNPGSGPVVRPLTNEPLKESHNPVAHLAWSPNGDQVVIWAAGPCGEQSQPAADCYGDLFLVDLNRGAAMMEAVRLTDSQIPFGQVTGLQWLGPDHPVTAEPPIRYAGLSQLPITANVLSPSDRVLLQTAAGPLALNSSLATLAPWQTTPADIGGLLAGDFTHFGLNIYASDGRHADLSFLPHPVIGRVLISPNGRFIAYEAQGAPDAELAGAWIYIHDLENGRSERATQGDSDLLGWSGDSRYLFIRSRASYLRIELLGPSGERVVRLNHFEPDLTGARPVLGTSDGRYLIWQTGAQMMNWMFIHRTAVVDVEGEESGRNRAYRLADQLFEPYVFSLSPDEGYLAYFAYERAGLYVRQVGSQAHWQLNQNAHIHHLTWSPDGQRLLVWATVDCLLAANTPLPNCYGDLYLFDLTNLTEAGYAPALRLTNSQIPYNQITGIHWFKE